MIQQLFTAVGVDYHQWRVMMHYSLQSANRSVRSLGGQQPKDQGKAVNKALVTFFIMNIIFGIAYSMMVLAIPSLSWSVFFVFSIIAISIGMTMLVEFGSLIISPEDYTVLSYQPISSRTYFAVKISFTFVYVFLTSLSLGLPSCIMFAFKNSKSISSLTFQPGIIIASLFAVVLLGISVSMLMILFYTTIMRFIKQSHLQNILSMLQMIMSFLIFGSYVILPKMMRDLDLGNGDILPTSLYFFPQSWFASIVFLANGSSNTATYIGALTGMLMFVAIIPMALGKISLSYAEDLSRTVSESQTSIKKGSGKATSSLWFTSEFETRAMALLVWGQFKHDTQFRLSILGMLPLTIFYLFMGLNRSDVEFDPFYFTMNDVMQSAFLYLPLLFLPTVLVEGTSKSRSYLASWIFFATPVSKAELILAMEKLLFRFYMLPYILFLGSVFFFIIPNGFHVVMHSIILLLFSAVTIKLLFIMYPRIPFSRPAQFAEKATITGLIIGILPFIVTIGLLFLFPLIYSTEISYGISILVFVSIYFWFDHVLKKRVMKKVNNAEYFG